MEIKNLHASFPPALGCNTKNYDILYEGLLYEKKVFEQKILRKQVIVGSFVNQQKM